MNRLRSHLASVRRAAHLGESLTDTQRVARWTSELAFIHGRAVAVLHKYSGTLSEQTVRQYQDSYEHAVETISIMAHSDQALNFLEVFMVNLELWLLRRRVKRLGR